MKSTKKLLSLLLVFVMIFSLAVPVFAEGETPATATKVDTLAAGDQVVIFNAGAGKVMTNEKTVYNNKDELKSAAATVADGKMTVPENAAILTVTVDENGKYSFTDASGKYLYMDSSNVRLVDAAEANTLFQLEAAEGGYFVKADTATFSGKAQYLEFYANCFTVYGMDSTKAGIYTFQFFKIDAV